MKKQMVSGLLQDNNVLGTSSGDQGDSVPGPAPTMPAAGLQGESWVKGSLPRQTMHEQH